MLTYKSYVHLILRSMLIARPEHSFVLTTLQAEVENLSLREQALDERIRFATIVL
jgi:hypothetical protein